MENYLVDEAVLSEFVDTLIAEKYPGRPATDLAGFKKEAIKNLDHRIMKAMLGQLTPDQAKEFDKILDDKNADESVFADFFKKQNIDLEKVIMNTMVKFKDDFMKGGDNA